MVERAEFNTHLLTSCRHKLLLDANNNTGAHRVATFSDGEAQSFFDGYRVYERNVECHVVSRHRHLYPFGQLRYSGDVGGSEVELRPVSLEEWRVPPSLFLG